MTTADIMKQIQAEDAARRAMSSARIVAKLHKTLASINAHIDRKGGNGSMADKRSQELADRYTGLKTALIDTNREDVWGAYCDAIDASPAHEGADNFA